MINFRQSDLHDDTLRDLAPDLTPMLDILFILLVFFMLTAGAVFQSLDLKLPSSVSKELPLVSAPKQIMLEIHEHGYVIDGKAVGDFEQLRLTVPGIIKQKPGHELVIAGDKSAPIQQLLEVLTYLQSQGIKTANILMRHKKTK